ncbi:MAG: hypothetical protein ACRC5H_06910 [Treponemataceae bacterium]
MKIFLTRFLFVAFTAIIFSCKTTQQAPQTFVIDDPHIYENSFDEELPFEADEKAVFSSDGIQLQDIVRADDSEPELLFNEMAIEKNNFLQEEFENEQAEDIFSDAISQEQLNQEDNEELAMNDSESLDDEALPADEITQEDEIMEDLAQESDSVDFPPDDESIDQKTFKSENTLPLPYIRKNSLGFVKEDEFANIKPSRSVTITKNQMLDIAYPGSGWVFLGEKKAVNILHFVGRQINNQDTLFTLRGTDSGKTIVHFYKQDLLKGSYIDDFLEVFVEPATAISMERVTAPDFDKVVAYDKAPLPQLKESISSTDSPLSNQVASVAQVTKQEQTPTVHQTPQKQEILRDQEKLSLIEEDEPPSVSLAEPIIPPAQLLSMAKDAQKNGNIVQSIQHLENFLASAESKIDEGLFLRGQLYEQNSELRNIRTALDSYETLMKTYPASFFWKDAQERATYLKRFYFNIR